MSKEAKAFDFDAKAAELAKEKQASELNADAESENALKDIIWDDQINGGDEPGEPSAQGSDDSLSSETKDSIYTKGGDYLEEMIHLGISNGTPLLLKVPKEGLQPDETIRGDIKKAWTATLEFYGWDVKASPVVRLIVLYLFAYIIPLVLLVRERNRAERENKITRQRRAAQMDATGAAHGDKGAAAPHPAYGAAPKDIQSDVRQAARTVESVTEAAIGKGQVPNAVHSAAQGPALNPCLNPGCTKQHTNKKYCSTRCANIHRAEMKKGTDNA